MVLLNHFSMFEKSPTVGIFIITSQISFNIENFNLECWIYVAPSLETR